MDTSADPISMDDLLRQRDWVRGLAGAIVGDAHTADDVAQDAWVTALERPPAQGPRLRGWLRRVVQSRAIDAHRSRARRATRESAQRPATESLTPQDLLAQARLQGDVARAVEALSEPYRMTVLLRYFRGHSARDVAEHLDVPLATVRTRLHRAHGMLRDALVRAPGAQEYGWQRACGLLVGSALQSTVRRGSPSITGAIAMTHAKKAALACAVLGLGMAGGWIGAQFGGASATPHDPSLLRAEDVVATTQSDDPAPALLAGNDDAALRALRRDVDALQAKLEDPRAGDDSLDERLGQIESMLSGVLAMQVSKNQSAAIATSRNCISALAQTQQSVRIDSDNDGTGEYGGFREMSGAVEGRMSHLMNPPVLSRAFKVLTEQGEAQRSGYLYRIYLPSSGGGAVGEPVEGFSEKSGIDADLAETNWCLYAWPVKYGVTGRLTFMTNTGGDVVATEDARYSGTGSGPKPDAAFKAGDALWGRVAIGVDGRDGNMWKQVN